MTFHKVGNINPNFIFPYIGNFIIPTDELIFFITIAKPSKRYAYLCFAFFFMWPKSFFERFKVDNNCLRFCD